MKISTLRPLLTTTARWTLRQPLRARLSPNIIHTGTFSTTSCRRKETPSPPAYVGSAKRLPEFNLVGKVVCVSGAGRGLGLVQAEALLEAGAIGKI